MFYFIPFMYGFKSRAKTYLNRVTFFFINSLPILITCIFVSSYNNGLKTFVVFILGYTSLHCVYEIGYIYNDVLTVKYEKNPSIWLPQQDILWVEKNFEILIAFRGVVSFSCILILVKLGVENVVSFAGLLVLLNMTYSIHNYIRCRINILTNMMLQIIKYGSTLMLLGVSGNKWFYIIFLLFSEPLLRSIEYSFKTRFHIKFFARISIDKFRVIYHTCMLLCAILIYTRIREALMLIVISAILMIFRAVCCILMRNKYIREIREKNVTGINR